MPNEQGKWNIAVVGATGLVGSAVVEILAKRAFPLGQLYPLASENSEGNSIEFGQHRLVVHCLADFDFRQVDLALFCVPEAVARQYVPEATAAGSVVIDLSAAYRLDSDVPLVAAAINPLAVSGYTKRNLIACPDSSILHTLLALQPLQSLSPLVHVDAVFMRAVSELGRAGIDELSAQSIAMFNLKTIESHCFDQQIAFNVLARAGGKNAGVERELEQQLQSELQKILQDPDIGVSATAVQVPVFFAHSATLHIEFKDKFSMEQARKTLSKSPRICLLDEPAEGKYASAVTHAANDDHVYVSRVREDAGRERGLDCWLVADNIRVAANNGVLVAEFLVKDYL